MDTLRASDQVVRCVVGDAEHVSRVAGDRELDIALVGCLIEHFYREDGRAERHAEIDGRWVFPGGFTLTGRADRLDRRRDGRLEILDFKTGALPSPAEMAAYLAPQLLLEAGMATEGAFEGLAAAPVEALTYVKIGLGPEAFVPRPFALRDGLDVTAAAEEARRRLMGHVDAFLLRGDRPMLAGLLPRLNQSFAGDYDHLARTDEWAMLAGDGSL